MPAKKTGVGMVHAFARKGGQTLALQPVIGLAIKVQVSDTAADPHLEIRLDGDQPRIEQLVEIRAQQKTVTDVMRALIRVRNDVGCFQCGQRVLAGHRALPLIRVDDEGTKRSLPKPRPLDERSAVSFVRDIGIGQPAIPEDGIDLGKKACTVRVPIVVGLPDHDAAMETRTHVDPTARRKIENVSQDSTADFGIQRDGYTPMAGDQLPEFGQAGSTVLLFEDGPCRNQRQAGVTHEVPTAHDVVVRRLQLEQEKCALGQAGKWWPG